MRSPVLFLLSIMISTMKKFTYLLVLVMLVASSCSTVKPGQAKKTTSTPPGQAKKTGNPPPGQMKKATGSKSAAPYAPGQQKKTSSAKKKS